MPPRRPRSGRALGTPAFMAPEQALGRVKTVDGRTDLWALGATMFSLLSGHFVHEGESGTETAVMAATRPAPRLEAVAPEVPLGLRGVVDKALAFEKGKRWSDAAEMRRALEEAAREVVEGGIAGLAAVEGVDRERGGTTAGAATAGGTAGRNGWGRAGRAPSVSTRSKRKSAKCFRRGVSGCLRGRRRGRRWRIRGRQAGGLGDVEPQ